MGYMLQCLGLLVLVNLSMAVSQDDSWKTATSIYEFSAIDIDGKNVSLEKYRGQVLLIVNVACKCALAGPNYKELEQLYEKYSESHGLRVLAFPCNDFANQEPGTEAEIKEFVKQYNVKFDMFSKIKVNGDGAHPLYKYLKRAQPGFLFKAIKWNFTKFLVNRKGVPVARYAPTTRPLAIEADLLKEF